MNNNFWWLILLLIPNVTGQWTTWTSTSLGFQTTTTTTTLTPTPITGTIDNSINATIIGMRPDTTALENLINTLPAAQQTQVRAIRGNIFLTIRQQNDQIADYLRQFDTQSLVSSYEGGWIHENLFSKPTKIFKTLFKLCHKISLARCLV